MSSRTGANLSPPQHPKNFDQLNPITPACSGDIRGTVRSRSSSTTKGGNQIPLFSTRSSNFQAPPEIPPFINTAEAIDEIPSYDAFESSPDDF